MKKIIFIVPVVVILFFVVLILLPSESEECRSMQDKITVKENEVISGKNIQCVANADCSYVELGKAPYCGTCVNLNANLVELKDLISKYQEKCGVAKGLGCPPVTQITCVCSGGICRIG